MRGKLALRGLALSVGLALALLALWWMDPTPTTLSQYTTSLQERTLPQLHNIRQAVQSLDGVYIQPGAVFSFNQVVGPRTLERGYLPAPVFMMAETLDSVGGGICQVSSSLYNAALLAGLEVVERHPHYRQVESVPPGLDATVWYGLADLRLRNPFPWPVRLRFQIRGQTLIVSVLGRGSHPAPAIPPIRVEQRRLDPQHLQVSVYRGNERLSQDRYVAP
ncbi:VanW family protein [Synechococcus sp. 65AY6Li]|uniref:VanW family protein n=1 Tax=Synechococcus sp. 65AY6Li TaxID=1351840 RepID=UPI001F0AE6F9|nr:VanW family protein [Synechococcus sp. 65AY6Li]